MENTTLTTKPEVHNIGIFSLRQLEEDQTTVIGNRLMCRKFGQGQDVWFPRYAGVQTDMHTLISQYFTVLADSK